MPGVSRAFEQSFSFRKQALEIYYTTEISSPSCTDGNDNLFELDALSLFDNVVSSNRIRPSEIKGSVYLRDQVDH